MTGVFLEAVVPYAQAGWPCVIPVPPEAKYPPPEGFTGAAGIDTSDEQLAEWATGRYRDWSVALRMPDGVLGIDVDDYPKGETVKHGADQLAEREAQWGPLPAAWSSTARGSGNGNGPGRSRIMFFRVPPGRYATSLGPDIDVIQRHHRYAVVAPSPHYEIGTPYRWYTPDGRLSERVPRPDELTDLPARWVQGLADGAAEAGPMAADAGSGRTLLDQLMADHREPCAEVASAEINALAALDGALEGSRHDTMTEHTYHLVQLGAEGHPGSGAALGRLEVRWDVLTAGEGREAEFTSMTLTAARKAVTRLGQPAMRDYDPCIVMPPGGIVWDAPAPANEAGQPAEGLVPPRLISVREYIGAQLFDPPGGLDHSLAQSALERMYPALRYAADADTWLLRGPWAWNASPADLSHWAVTELTWLMPHGDPDADKDTPEGQALIAQAGRRKRFGTAASANGIARKMKTHVLAGTHPCSCELTELDAQPEILWAGGQAWDLRASINGPAWSGIDPGTPHLHAAGITPAVCPTPLWDAYTRAVWPDPDVRGWALRVLSIALTGYPDKTLPILLGKTDRGKTEIISLLMSVLGSYAHAADPRLLSSADRSHASIIAVLKGRRMSFIDEAPRSGHQAQERLKQLTGGAALTGNLMNKNPVTFVPTHTLILTANPESEPVLTDAAVRRRVRLLPCEGDPREVIAARMAIGPLRGAAWQAEAPGVLAFMMSQTAAWLADRASASNEAAPESIRSAADQIATDQDLVLTWIQNECEPYPEGTKSRPLFEEFVASCRRGGVQPAAVPSETAWGRRLNELGYPSWHTREGNFRALRVRRPGGFSAVPLTGFPPASAEVKGHAASVQGGEGGSAKPFTPENPSSGPIYSSLVKGVKSTKTSLIQEEEKEEHTRNIGRNDTSPGTHHAANGKTASDLGQHPVLVPITPITVPVTRHGAGISLGFDLETASSTELFHRPEGFVRLCGVIGPEGEPVIADGPEELLGLLDEAGEVYGHNILGFDGIALAWHHRRDDPGWWDRFTARARDTELIARQADPPRSRDAGHSADRYGLDQVAEKLGVAGKTDSLVRLKNKFGGYDKIPVDDPEYRSYLEGDLLATKAVADLYRNDPYTGREHQFAALAGRMTLNGFRVDQDLLAQRLEAGETKKRAALAELGSAYGLPLIRVFLKGRGSKRHEETMDLDSPLACKEGQVWLERVWREFGVTDPPRTQKSHDLAIGANDLAPIAAAPGCHPVLKAILDLMTIVTTTRTVYQTAANGLCPDGRVHPGNSFRQASGRCSTTNPGLTVFGKRGGRHIERDIFLPDEGHVLISCDLSQVDMRAMAGHCQDPAYMALFAPGRDAHTELATQVGLERQDAKPIGHGWNYGLGADSMIKGGPGRAPMDPAKVHAFISGMEANFPRLIEWREEIRAIGAAGELLDNGFGRRMRCDPQRAYTVAPALMGQGGARDILRESLLQLPRELDPYLRVMVHDEVVLSVPADDVAEIGEIVREAMTWTWRNVPVLCDQSKPGKSWGEISAK